MDLDEMQLAILSRNQRVVENPLVVLLAVFRKIVDGE